MKSTSALSVIVLLLFLGLSGLVSSVPPPLHPYVNEDGYMGLAPGITWLCCPVNTSANASNMGTQDNVSWLACWNTTTDSWNYWFPTDDEGHGTGTNFDLAYTDGLVAYLSDTTYVNMSYGAYPYPAHIELEFGLSLHGNPAPIDLNASYICDSVLDGDAVSWCAIWNITGEKFDYYFPSNGGGINFEAWAFGGIWFYQTSGPNITIEYGIPPDQIPN